MTRNQKEGRELPRKRLAASAGLLIEPTKDLADQLPDLHEHPEFVQRIVAAFPGGPPNEEIAEAVLQAELDAVQSAVTRAQAFGTMPVAKFDTDTRYEMDSPGGINITMTKHGKSWRLVVTSPKSPNGKSCSITQVMAGDKLAAMTALGEFITGMVTIGEKLIAQIEPQDGKPIEDVPEGLQKINMVMRHPFETQFDSIYSGFNDMIRSKVGLLPEPPEGGWPPNTANVFEVITDAVERMTYPGAMTVEEVVIAAMMQLHELWKQRHDDIFEEEWEQAMAKNNGEHVWWLVTGGRKPMKKIVNILQSNRHFIVQGDDENCYLRIQNAELTFVKGLASEYNCRAKLCDEPEYGLTLCGKNHLNPKYHQSRCNACNRVRANESAALKTAEAKEAADAAAQAENDAQAARAEAAAENKAAVATEPAFPSTTSPDGKFTSGVGSMLPNNPKLPPPHGRKAEEREWAAKNGEVITVQGAKTGIDPMDFSSLATDYRRISDELLERASYYTDLAEKYESLMKPTDAVRAAEAALAAAKANEDTERQAQLAALMTLISEGPPER